MKNGTLFNFGKYQIENETPWPIQWEIVHQTKDYQIAQTKQVIDLRAADAAEPNNPNNSRKELGNNNWSVSNIKQFLNSDKENWYSAQHEYDAPPNSDNIWDGYGNRVNPYDTHKGFLYYFSAAEKYLLKDMTFDLVNPIVDGGGSYTWTGKVWLPTYTQMTGLQNNDIAEGSKFDKYTDDNSRIKTLHENCAIYNPYCKLYNAGKPWHYWTSSTNPEYACSMRMIYCTGYSMDYVYLTSSFVGIAPCICLPIDFSV